MNFGVAMPFNASTPDDHLAGAKPDQEHDLRRAPLLSLDIFRSFGLSAPWDFITLESPGRKPEGPTFESSRSQGLRPIIKNPEMAHPTIPTRSGKNKTITTGWVNLVDEKDIPRPEEASTDLAALQVFLSFRLVSGSGLRSLRVWFTGSLVSNSRSRDLLLRLGLWTSGFAKPRSRQSLKSGSCTFGSLAPRFRVRWQRICAKRS